MSNVMTRLKYRTHLGEIMKQRGLTRMDIVRGANLSYPTVMRLETSSFDRLEAETVESLMKFLSLSHDDLIYTVQEAGPEGKTKK
jgi:hypothetical protein